ncbi:hypothetical protein H3H37_25310 [Duganella sp. LX20W]|uniref:Uncharacterized protein n=1 Tax=Rugamonas brunnea TaxID=2758569 RepID=A0A7W2EXG0_9BURK|nr:STY0301 family protein [Rugamonas brunnea]MBA5640382.1 hypothetical protein [Rugamonas brunnea]
MKIICAYPSKDKGNHAAFFLRHGAPSTMTISKLSFAGTVRGQDVEKWTQLSEMVGVEKWMACFYGENGQHDVLLSKRIDDSTAECTETYPKKNDKLMDIRCQWQKSLGLWYRPS